MNSHELAKLLLELPDAEIRMWCRDWGEWNLGVDDVEATNVLGNYSQDRCENVADKCKYIKLHYD
jgi:hypothetical protein